MTITEQPETAQTDTPANDTAPADDMRSVIAAAITESKTPKDEGEGASAKAVKAAPAKDAAEPDGADDKAEKPEGDAAAEGEGAEQAEGEQPGEGATVAPPSNWSAADKEMFGKQTPEAQKFLLSRHKAMEADYTKKTAEIASLKREYEPVDQMFAPHRERLQQSGWTPSRLIQAWASVEQGLMQDAPGTIKRIAQTYGVDLSKLATGGAQERLLGDQNAQQQPPGGAVLPEYLSELAPVLDPLQKQLADLTSKLAQRDEADKMAGQRAFQDTYRRTLAEVETFANAKDDKGNAAHPHYADVETDMALLAQADKAAGRRVDLQSLYERAVWANPTTRAKLIAADQEAQQSKAQAEARAKAAAAKKAGSSVTGAPNGGQPLKDRAPKERSLREELEAARSAQTG